MDKLLIEVHKAEEGLDLLDLHWGRPLCDSVDLQDDQSEVLNLLLLKLTFLWLEKQPPLSEVVRTWQTICWCLERVWE